MAVGELQIGVRHRLELLHQAFVSLAQGLHDLLQRHVVIALLDHVVDRVVFTQLPRFERDIHRLALRLSMQQRHRAPLPDRDVDDVIFRRPPGGIRWPRQLRLRERLEIGEEFAPFCFDGAQQGFTGHGVGRIAHRTLFLEIK